MSDQLITVVMDDGTYFKSSRSGGGGCVVARSEEVPDLTDTSLADLLGDPATAAVRARVVDAPQVETVFLPGGFNSYI